LETGHTIFYRDNITDDVSTLHKTALVGRWNNNESILNWHDVKYEAPAPDIPCAFFTTVLPAVNSKYDFNLPFIRTHKLNTDKNENVIHEGIRGPYKFFNYPSGQLPKLSGKYLNNDEYVGENNVVFYMKSTNVITTPYLATITINTETNTSNNTDNINQDNSPIMLLNDESIPEKSENTQSEVKTIIKPNAQNFKLDSTDYLNTPNIKFTNITGHTLSALNYPDDYYDNEYNKPDDPDKPDEPQPIHPVITDKDRALKITAQDNNVVIKFTPSEQYTGLIYQTSNMEYAAYYTGGQEIMLASNAYVLFENTEINLNKLSNSINSIGKFNITGTVILAQNIQSLLKYSDYCTPYCYQELFSECIDLVSATILPATKLAPYCYSGMFRCCTSLVNAPELPATTLAENCYEYMFQGCDNLNYVNVRFTDWNDSNKSTYNWLQKVSSTGTFVCPEDLDRTKRGNSYIPIGWTIDDR
jgi:hypothetical protein